MSKVGRNDACPCGSELKYKQCCALRVDTLTADKERVSRLKGRDVDLIKEMLAWAPGNVAGFSVYANAPIPWTSYSNAAASILLPWAIFHSRPLGGGTVAEAYFASEPRPLTAIERTALDIQRRAWLGAWAIEAKGPGPWLHVRCALTGQRKAVLDTIASQTVQVGDVLLARVVELPDLATFAGMFPRVLTAGDMDRIVAVAREVTRTATGAIAPAALRDDATVSALIREADAVCAAADAEQDAPSA